MNLDIGIYLKYATTRTKTKHKEHVFTFRKPNLDELAELKARHPRVFVCFVCVPVQAICCISCAVFDNLIAERLSANKGVAEDAYQVLVTAPPSCEFRVYVNPPDERNKTLGLMTVPRSEFPKCLFP